MYDMVKLAIIALVAIQAGALIGQLLRKEISRMRAQFRGLTDRRLD